MHFTDQITFLAVADLQRSADFYGRILGLELVTDQGDCRIYRVTGRAFLGICTRTEIASAGVIFTLVTDDVDGWHIRLRDSGVECERPPAYHPKYDIYQAFYRDPDGHRIEIQRFNDDSWRQPSLAGR